MPGQIDRGMAGRILAFVLPIYLLSAAGHLHSPDVTMELRVAQSLIRHSNFTAGPQVRSVPGRDGRLYSSQGLGETILLLPAAIAGELAGPDRAERVATFSASLINAAVASLSVFLMFVLVSDLGFAVAIAAKTSLIFALATIWWTYAHAAFDIVPTSALLLLSLLALRRARLGIGARWWLISGGAAAGALLFRLSALVALLPLAGYAFAGAPRAGNTRWSALLRWSAPIAAVLALNGVYNFARFGSVFETGYSRMDAFGFSTPLLVGLTGQLVSPGKSLFLYSPVLIAALWGWPGLIRRDRALALTMLAIVALNLLFHGRFNFWAGDDAWGPRFTLPYTALLVLPVAVVLAGLREAPGARRALFALLLGASVAVQPLGILVDYQIQLEIQAETVSIEQVHWTPGHSPLLRHAAALSELARGRAAYPAARRVDGNPTAHPTAALPDLWWTYAWHLGYPRGLIIALVGLLAAWIVAAGLALSRRLRASG